MVSVSVSQMFRHYMQASYWGCELTRFAKLTCLNVAFHSFIDTSGVGTVIHLLFLLIGQKVDMSAPLVRAITLKQSLSLFLMGASMWIVNISCGEKKHSDVAFQDFLIYHNNFYGLKSSILCHNIHEIGSLYTSWPGIPLERHFMDRYSVIVAHFTNNGCLLLGHYHICLSKCA